MDRRSSTKLSKQLVASMDMDKNKNPFVRILRHRGAETAVKLKLRSNKLKKPGPRQKTKEKRCFICTTVLPKYPIISKSNALDKFTFYKETVLVPDFIDKLPPSQFHPDELDYICDTCSVAVVRLWDLQGKINDIVQKTRSAIRLRFQMQNQSKTSSSKDKDSIMDMEFGYNEDDSDAGEVIIKEEIDLDIGTIDIDSSDIQDADKLDSSTANTGRSRRTPIRQSKLKAVEFIKKLKDGNEKIIPQEEDGQDEDEFNIGNKSETDYDSDSSSATDIDRIDTDKKEKRKGARRTRSNSKQPITCDMCDKSFCSKRTLKHHERRIHLKITRHKCTECDKGFYKKGDLDTHFAIRHLPRTPKDTDPTAQKCDICEKLFRTKNDLRSHKQRVHLKVIRHKCTHCAKNFFHKGDHDRHVAVHHAPKTPLSSTDPGVLKCDKCEKLFREKHLLKYHQERIHMKLERYHCPQCNKGYYTKGDLAKHVKVHPVLGESGDLELTEIFKCDECDRTFSHKIGLKSHKNRVHLGVKKCQCELCDKEFYSRGELAKHMTTHTGIKAFSCEKCGKSYAWRNKLAIHERACGGGEKKKKVNMKCPYCNKCFLDKQTLQDHRESNHPEYEEQRKKSSSSKTGRSLCEICGKYISRLMRHVCVNDQERKQKRKYECPMCQKRFRLKQELAKHEESHAEGEGNNLEVDSFIVSDMSEVEVRTE